MYTTTTLEALQDDLQYRWDAMPFWTTEESRLALNEALRLFNLYTSYWKRRYVTQTVANQVYYTTPAIFTHNVRVEWNQIPLAVTSVEDQDAGRPDWEADRAGAGGEIPDRPTVWIPCGLSTFAVWPADPTATNGLTVDGIRVTPVLVDPGDLIDVGEEEHGALLAYALHALLFKGPRDAWRASRTTLYPEFLRTCVKHNPRLRLIPRIQQQLGETVPTTHRRAVTGAA